MPERVGTEGRKLHMQWLGTKRQPAQRSPLMPPRAIKGLVLRNTRAVRKRDTAWGGGDIGGMKMELQKRSNT